ncbi:MAG: prolipoprotein diacylglyceryl transferase [Mogibacterium sp.]|nr:prolipoprotein diacylglyceryl transferase [Mogibacterium sp.]
MTSPGPIAFTIFGMDIRWYGILIAAGAMLAVLISCKRAPRYGLKPDDVLDVVLWMLPVGIIGARLYYVVFQWEYYQGDIAKILNLRGGGLAIHGGLLFGIITVWLVCRHKKIPFLEMTDLILPTVALAQSIGRWGNFFNSEAHGTETDLPWAILVDGKYVHPTFLYESIWCLILFIVLVRIARKRRFVGQISCLYGILYSAERFFVEGLRTDSLMIGPLRQAQVISIVILLFCVCVYIYLQRRSEKQ